MNLKDIQLNKDHKIETLKKKFGASRVWNWILAGDLYERKTGYLRRLW